MNQLSDDGLNYSQTEGWNQHPDKNFFARYARPRPRRGEWTDNHSLGLSSVIKALPGMAERLLPCLHFDLVYASHSFTLQLRREPPESGISIYDALRKVMIEGTSSLSKIKLCGEALCAQGPLPRKAAELVASMTWLEGWAASKPDLAPPIRHFIVSALNGEAQHEAVYRTIESLREGMDRASFTVLRAHLNRLTALRSLVPVATTTSDRARAKAGCDEVCRNFEMIVKRLFESHALQGDYMDSVSVITLISSGLKMVDQFRELAIRFKGQTPTPPSGKAEQVGTALEVRHGANLDKRVEASQLHMDQWDAVRYDALSKRIRTQWEIYNDLFANEAAASIQEGARVRADMRKTQDELCRDFKEMVRLYERALGTSLPDHYQLYEVCQA